MQGQLNSRGACAEPASAGGTTEGGKMRRPANVRGGPEAEQNTDGDRSGGISGSCRIGNVFLGRESGRTERSGSGLMGFAEVVWKGRPGLQTPQQAGRRRDTCLFGDGWRATERPMVRSGTEVYGCLCKRQQRQREGWVRSVFCCSVASVAGSVHTWSSCSAGDTDRLTRGAGWRRCGPGWARPGWTAAPACTCADEGGWERWGGAGWEQLS